MLSREVFGKNVDPVVRNPLDVYDGGDQYSHVTPRTSRHLVLSIFTGRRIDVVGGYHSSEIRVDSAFSHRTV